MMNKKHFIVAALLLVSGSAFALSDSASYAQLFQDSIINNTKVNGDLAKAEAYTDCHMTALGAFPSLLKSEVFQVASDTNSYTEARKQFGQLIVLEMSASDQRKQAINDMIEQSKSIGKACLASVDS